MLKTLHIRCCILRILFQLTSTLICLLANYLEIYSRLKKKKKGAVIGSFSDLGIFAHDPIGLKRKTSVVYWIQTFVTRGVWGQSYQEQKAEQNRWKSYFTLSVTRISSKIVCSLSWRYKCLKKLKINVTRQLKVSCRLSASTASLRQISDNIEYVCQASLLVAERSWPRFWSCRGNNLEVSREC